MTKNTSESSRPENEVSLIQPERLFTEVHVNVSQELIQVTEDKLTLILERHSSSLAKRDAWIPPLSLCVPIWTTLMTANFESNLLPAATWDAIFVMAGVLSVGWLLWTLHSMPKKPTVAKLVDVIKGRDS